MKNTLLRCIIYWNMNATRYAKVLEFSILPYIEECYRRGHKLQQANDPKHTSKYIKKVLRTQCNIVENSTRISWPQSHWKLVRFTTALFTYIRCKSPTSSMQHACHVCHMHIHFQGTRVHMWVSWLYTCVNCIHLVHIRWSTPLCIITKIMVAFADRPSYM